MNFLDVSRVSRQEDGRFVLQEVNFTLLPLQNTAVAGATGSGKTTLLKIIGGLLTPTSGTVYFEGERVKGPNERLLPGHPAIAYLSQHFELRNHYRVHEILEMASKTSAQEAARIYEVCRIAHLLKRWTHQLSGGERQRIALARLLVTQPRLLLLDEPFSNLDPFHKNGLKSVLDEVSASLNVTSVLVSHDPQDALSWARRILVLREGKPVQEGSPEELYRRPANRYVAGLFGKYTALTPALRNAFDRFLNGQSNRANDFVRPEAFLLTTGEHGVKASVKKVRFNGGAYEVAASIAGEDIILTTPTRLAEGGEIYVSLAADTGSQNG